MKQGLLCGLCLLFSASVNAEVLQQSDSGFEISHSISVQNDPMEIHRTLTQAIGEWWVSSHTYSGDSANLQTSLEPGGGLYERLPDGGMVEHLRLLYFAKGKAYRWEGALGPLQPMAVSGRLGWTIDASEQGKVIKFNYKVWGNPPGGLAQWAAPVDGMMKETITSLAARLARD